MAKMASSEGKVIRHSLSWLTSRRGTLRVMSDALEFGNLRMHYDEIDEAVLIATSQMFIPCYVLRIVCKDRIYQFGLNPGSYWKGELPFSVKRVRMRLGYSWFSMVARVIGALLAGYLVWTWFTR
jgi:hypothetical protein